MGGSCPGGDSLSSLLEELELAPGGSSNKAALSPAPVGLGRRKSNSRRRGMGASGLGLADLLRRVGDCVGDSLSKAPGMGADVGGLPPVGVSWLEGTWKVFRPARVACCGVGGVLLPSLLAVVGVPWLEGTAKALGPFGGLMGGDSPGVEGGEADGTEKRAMAADAS